jgi:Galactose oxidase, central domain
MLGSRFLLVSIVVGACIVAIGLSAPSPTESAMVGSIVPGAGMRAPRSGHTATLLPDGRVLIAGGMRRNQDFYRSAELLDPKSGQFQLTGEMVTARVGHEAVLLPSGNLG